MCGTCRIDIPADDVAQIVATQRESMDGFEEINGCEAVGRVRYCFGRYSKQQDTCDKVYFEAVPHLCLLSLMFDEKTVRCDTNTIK